VADRDFDFLSVTLGITTGLCITAFASGYGLSLLFKVDQADRVSLMYGLGMNNNGTGLVLASLVLGSYPRVMVTIILYNVVQHLVAGGVHQVTGRNVGDQRWEEPKASTLSNVQNREALPNVFEKISGSSQRFDCL